MTTIIEEKQTRNSTGFLIKQRAFLKLYLITELEKGRPYGYNLWEDLYEKFKPFGYKPGHSEIYRALHELEDDEGIIKREIIKKEGSKRKEVIIYRIVDPDKAKAYKELVKVDMDRSMHIIRKALEDNYA